MKNILIPFTLLLLCNNPLVYGNNKIIKNFSEIDENINQIVTVEGYISRNLEASGLYFNIKDLKNGNKNCILPQPFGSTQHKQKTKITGYLKRTECGKTLICLNTCSNYVLEQISSEDDFRSSKN